MINMLERRVIILSSSEPDTTSNQLTSTIIQ